MRESPERAGSALEAIRASEVFCIDSLVFVPHHKHFAASTLGWFQRLTLQRYVDLIESAINKAL